MSEHSTNGELSRELDRLVERVARKAGYAGAGETYREHLQRKIVQGRAKLTRKVEKFRHKLSLKAGNRDFAEEIKAYLADGIAEMTAAGVSQADALRITMEKFDEAELRTTFDDFMQAFDDFGMDAYRQNATPSQPDFEDFEAAGRLYGGLLMLGVALGALIGFLGGGRAAFLTGGWIDTLIGAGVGATVGIALGEISNALVILLRRE
ncbi:hypothetical protein FACS1894196_2110 [Clostridia bacterium]|nr:hypothetical protein FACS1894196_2110 [Clostridia bacterium]